MRNDVEIVYPVHLNPNVRKVVRKIIKNEKRIHLIEPLSYEEFVHAMKAAYLILTDSGGIQEEAPSLNKPVLVMREVTEREEGVKAGCARLVGMNVNSIVKNVMALLKDKALYNKMSSVKNPYGDGRASKRIADILKKA
jgi:UDP-N-acetylglucosamine 2-epimerase